ncbi:MAG: hydroxyisourate hydrolase [Bacteroidetes bacterium]|nr:hydroxyisourate hydrolase [Bacteroidota bacterium]MCW5895159.1 hydroxyisourate hydrolase [Bacteroidota bacterium]
MRSPVTTHILDTALGRPAEGIPVVLEMKQVDGAWNELGRGVSNSDGRVADLLPEDFHLAVGIYRITFLTAEYFRLMNRDSFYTRVVVEFAVKNGGHYHVPLLLSPFGYSTYRGS